MPVARNGEVELAFQHLPCARAGESRTLVLIMGIEFTSAHWGEHFLGTLPVDLPTYRTQDSDLGELDSHLVGGHWRWGAARQWDVGLNYLSRSDGLDHVFFSFGWTTSY